MEANFGRHRSRCDVVRSTESRKEVVQSVLVRDVYGSEPKAPFALVAVEEVVIADRGVEEASRRDARRILVIILSPGRRDADQTGSEL